jgi:hypothetical protein
MVFIGDEVCWGKIKNRNFQAFPSHNSTTSSVETKGMLRLDSAHQKGPELPFHEVLTVVGDSLYGG